MMYVYLYTDPIRNEPIYVGMGHGMRAWHHIKRTDVHPFVQRLQMIKRMGFEPVVSIIETGLQWNEASKIEKETIAKLGRKDLGLGTLLNLTDGGEGLINASAETRRKIGEASRNRKPDSLETRAKKGWSKGKKRNALSENTKQILSTKAKDRGALSEEHRKNIGIGGSKRCTVDGVVFFESRKELKLALGQGKSGIYHPNFRYV